MRIDILTLFPEMCESVLGESIIGRARKDGFVEINCRQIRDYSLDKHKRVDDTPYGGGMGMVMQVQPVYDCYMSLCEEIGKKPHLVFMSPQGKVLTQQRVRELAEMDNLAILCGHYEGIDERVILADSVSRMLPGVLADTVSFTDESHYSSLLEYPQYTRPFEWHGRAVPDILLSGHHANIEKYRREQSLERTYRRRPDMLSKAVLDKKDIEFLRGLKAKIKDEEKELEMAQKT